MYGIGQAVNAIISRKYSDHLVFSEKAFAASISFRLFQQISVCVLIQNFVQLFAFGISFNLMETLIKTFEIQLKTLFFYITLHVIGKLLSQSWSVIKRKAFKNVPKSEIDIKNEFYQGWKLQNKSNILFYEFHELIYLFVTFSAIVIFIHQMHFCNDLHVYRDIYRGTKGNQADRLSYIFSLMMTILPFPL